MTDKNNENVIKKETILSLSTIKCVGRILKKIRETNRWGVSQTHQKMLKDIGFLKLFLTSDSIANKKYPPPQDKEYMDYRIEHFKKVLKEKNLLIG